MSCGSCPVPPPVGGSGTLEPVAPCPTTELRVTVRRDFPLREGEKLGDWRWSETAWDLPDRQFGDRLQEPMLWEYSSEEDPAANACLDASPGRGIFGWGIGNPGHGGHSWTTDHVSIIAADVKLLERTGGVECASTRTSGPNGDARLDTGRRTGEFIIRVVPDHHNDETEVGPELADEDNPPDLLYRTLDVHVRLQIGLLVEVRDPYDPPAGRTHGRVGNLRLRDPKTDHLPLSLKPIWWKDPNVGSRNINVFDIDLFVIHCTGGVRLGGALNTFFDSTTGAHYILDVDGHLIKLAQERHRVAHCNDTGNRDRWQRTASLRLTNQYSVGLEIVNNSTTDRPSYASTFATESCPRYPAEQYNAVIGLARNLVAVFPGIRHRIIGHNDVASGPRHKVAADVGIPPTLLHRRKPWDPGERFRWELLERNRPNPLGMVPGEHFDSARSYSGVFASTPVPVLSEGPHNPAYTGAIRELKQDIADIGYSIHTINGNFDRHLGGAVDRFKRHFFSGDRGEQTGRAIDRETADRIKNVAEEVRSGEQEYECWLVRFTRATSAKFHTSPDHHHSYERGLIAVYASPEDATAPGEPQWGYPWRNTNDGNWERWVVLTTRAKGFRIQGDDPRGIVGIYHCQNDANMEVMADNPWPSP